MTHDELIQKIATTVKVANKAQEASDVINEVGKLDVDLPWRKRDDVATENEEQEEQETIKSTIGAIQEEQPQDNLLRNLLIGGGLGAIFLFFSRRSKADETAEVRTDMYLTPAFMLSEFLVSTDVPDIKTYKLSQGELRNVVRVATVLQAVRDSYGKPIRVNSGGRPATLIARSGNYQGLTMVQILTEKGYSPAAHSQHMDFSAADWTVSEKNDLPNLFRKIVDMSNKEPFNKVITQAILYIEDRMPNFIHTGVTSDVMNFNITNRFLVADIFMEEGKRKTRYYAYDENIVRKILTSGGEP